MDINGKEKTVHIGTGGGDRIISSEIGQSIENTPIGSAARIHPDGKSIATSPIFQIALFLPLILFMSGDLGMVLVNKLLIIIDLGLRINEVDIIIGISFIVQGTFTFIFGYLADKYPRKWLLIIGGEIYVSGTIATALAFNFPSLLIARLWTSIGLGAQAPVTFSLLSDLFPSEKRSNSFAWWGVANMIGSLITGSFAIAANEIDFNKLDMMFFNDVNAKIEYIVEHWPHLCTLWRVPFRQVGTITLFLLFLLFLVREPKRAATEKQLRDVLADEEIDYSRQYKINISDLKYIFKRKTNIFLVLNFVDNVTSGVLVTNLVMYITLELGISIDFSHLGLGQIFLLLGLLIALGIGLWGQFYFARKGDKLYTSGDIRGRIKIMTYCAIFMIPFLSLAFALSPSTGTYTIFGNGLFGNPVKLSEPIFWTVFLMMFVLIGIGLAGSFGGTPNWYASLLDVNLPEQRGTMIAVASFMDTLGRSLGTIVGGFFLAKYYSEGVPAPIGMMMMTMQLIFGILSALMTIPALFTCEKDLKEVAAILEKRAKELEKMKEKKAEKENNEN